MSPTTRRWFLPHSPDVLGMLSDQIDVTVQGLTAFAQWAGGEPLAGDVVRQLEHEADSKRTAVLNAVQEAFTTPLDPEDLYALSHDLDEVLNAAKNTVREAEILRLAPDHPMAEMAQAIADGVTHLQVAYHALGKHRDAAQPAAQAAIKRQRSLERTYRNAMSQLLDGQELHTVLGYQELYRRLNAISDQVRRVAERVEYVVVKEA
jgi:uncharacterized protein Yka (UPF0111/DUF47 family)